MATARRCEPTKARSPTDASVAAVLGPWRRVHSRMHQRPPSASASLPRSTSSYVVVLVMENAESREVIGSPQAPYANALARRYGLATQSYAITHPSLPNYLALTSGSTHGVSSDCTDCHFPG